MGAWFQWNRLVKYPAHVDATLQHNIMHNHSALQLHTQYPVGQYSCDDTRSNWESKRISAHSVAAAGDNGEVATL